MLASCAGALSFKSRWYFIPVLGQLISKYVFRYLITLLCKVIYDCFALWHMNVQEMILLEITYKTFKVRNRFAILWHFALVDDPGNSVRTLTFKMVYQCLIKVKVFLVYFANNLNNAFAFCTLSFANISALETTNLTYWIHKSHGNYLCLLLSLFYWVMFIYFKRNRLDC